MTDSNLTPLPPAIIDIHNHVAKDDPGGDKLIALMDSLNISHTVVLGNCKGVNQHAVQAIEKHPDRFIGGVCVDPRDGDSAIDLVKAHHAQGWRIVKLFPNMGYFPDDEALRPFFDMVAELKMGVLSHCGWLDPRAGVSAAYYSNPGRFEKLVRTYTQTPFIFAHMGGIDGFLQAIMLTTRTPNAYVDCSPGQGAWVLTHAGQMVASIPPHKLMWGADSYCHQDWLNHNHAALDKIGFGPHLAKIFHDNAMGLLRSLGAMRG